MNKIINNIKSLSIDMMNNQTLEELEYGYSLSPILYTLFLNHLNINVNDSNWKNRDRLIVTTNKGLNALYSTLCMVGYFSNEDLKQNKYLGLDLLPGLLSSGIATSIGMSYAEKLLEEKTILEKESLIKHKIYVICGTEELLDGTTFEAFSLAGELKLDNLIVIYNACNKKDFNKNLKPLFESMNWNYFYLKNNDEKLIDKTIKKAKLSNCPAFIEIESLNNLDNKVILSKENLEKFKYDLNIPKTPYFIDVNEQEKFKQTIFTRSIEKYNIWASNYQKYHDKIENSFNFIFNKEKYQLPELTIDFDKKISTYEAQEKIITLLNEKNKSFICISDILNFKNCLYCKERKLIIGHIANALALYNFDVLVLTNLETADYLYSSLKITSYLNIPITYSFINNFIWNNPLNMPINQLSILRTIPNLYVYKPSDILELIGCFKENVPSKIIVTSKQPMPIIGQKDISKGAYVINPGTDFKAIIIASGTDLLTAYNLKQDLEINNNIKFRIVSMPNRELFLKQSLEYQEEILPKGYKKFVIESGNKNGYEGLVYSDKYIFSINKFSNKKNKEEILNDLGIDYETIKEKILSIL